MISDLARAVVFGYPYVDHLRSSSPVTPSLETYSNHYHSLLVLLKYVADVSKR